jgi:hypothetical protein
MKFRSAHANEAGQTCVEDLNTNSVVFVNRARDATRVVTQLLLRFYLRRYPPLAEAGPQAQKLRTAAQLVKYRSSTSLCFPFAYLANTRRKSVTSVRTTVERIGRAFSNMPPALSRGNVRTVTRPDQSGYGEWDEGREGYLDLPRKPVYAPAAKPKQPSGRRHRFSVSTEGRIGSLIAVAGMIWAAYAATVDYAGLWRFQILPPGPIEMCALGVLTWLHAKWRRSNKAG